MQHFSFEYDTQGQHSSENTHPEMFTLFFWSAFYEVSEMEFSKEWSYLAGRSSITLSRLGVCSQRKGTVYHNLTNFNEYLVHHCFENSTFFLVCSDSVGRLTGMLILFWCAQLGFNC